MIANLLWFVICAIIFLVFLFNELLKKINNPVIFIRWVYHQKPDYIKVQFMSFCESRR